MRITQIMLVGIVLIILGITAFAYQGFAMQTGVEGQTIWVLPPIVAGDFNGGTEMLPDFDVTAAPTVSPIDFIVLGNPASYSTSYVAGFEAEVPWSTRRIT